MTAGPQLAVVCAAHDVAARAAAVALAISARGPALALSWSPAEPGWAPRVPAIPAAARLAGSLHARGIEARASLRLVHAHVADAAGARMALAASDRAPAVIGVAVPRTAAVDAVLAAMDGIVIALDGACLSTLATASAARLGPPVAEWTAALPPGAAALARAGLASPALPADVARLA